MLGEIPDDVRLDILARCSFDEQISELSVVGVDDLTTVSAIVVERPLGQQKSRPLVAFCKPLCPGHAEGKYGRRLNWIVETVNGPQSRFDPVQSVRLVKRLVTPSNPLVDRYGETDIWLPQ